MHASFLGCSPIVVHCISRNGLIAVLLVTLALGCAKDEEVSDVPAPELPSVSETDSTEPHTDDLIADDVNDVNLAADDTARTDPGSADSEQGSPSPEATDNIPQAVIDAPIRNYVEQYENKKPRRKFTAKVLSNGRYLFHGPYVEYRPDGSVLKYGNYKYSQKVGEWTFLSNTGTVVKKGHYENDNPEGEWRVYRNDATLIRIERYRKGLANGVWVGFRKDGSSKHWQREFKAKKKVGTWSEFYEDGSKSLEQSYNDAGKPHGPQRRWYPNGKPKSEYHYKDGLRHGPSRDFDLAGNMIDVVTWENGERKIGSGT